MHPVYPEGPDCRESCAGAETTQHHDYAEGFIAGEGYQSTLVIAVLVKPKPMTLPVWVNGPTKKSWFREGIAFTHRTLHWRNR